MSYCWPSGGQRGILMQWVTDRDISISNIDKIFHIYWQTSTKLFVHQLPQYFIYTKPSKSLFWPFLLETIQSNHLQTDININTRVSHKLSSHFDIVILLASVNTNWKIWGKVWTQFWDTLDISECFAFVSFINQSFKTQGRQKGIEMSKSEFRMCNGAAQTRVTRAVND